MLAGLVLALLPAAASAQPARPVATGPRLALRSISCTGLTVVGSGLPKLSVVTLALFDKHTGDVLARRTVRSDVGGRFSVRMKASLDKVQGVRVLVRKASGGMVGFVDHTLGKGRPMCRLPYTGSTKTLLSLAAGFMVASGSVLLLTTRGPAAYWPRQLAPARARRNA